MRKSLYDFCHENEKEYLLAEWIIEKNLPLTLESVSYGSKKKISWRCKKGHEWRAVVNSRTGGTGCPVCANRVVVPGVNDLATTHPELVRQWDTEKNEFLTPALVTAGNEKKVWWRCGKGHSWAASIASRAKGRNCPVCAGKLIVPGENDLASVYPNIAMQWHPTKNGDLTPENCAPARNRKVWWLCPLGHEYQAVVGSRTVNGAGCPYCAGRRVLKGFNDLATLAPEVAAQWHPTLNGALTPEMVTTGSRKKVWWQCADGHVWKSAIYSRAGVQKTGCPVCANQVNRARRSRYAAILKDSVQHRGSMNR